MTRPYLAAAAAAAAALAIGAGGGAAYDKIGGEGCTSVPLAVAVDLRDDHEQVVGHVRVAVAAGYPRVLHIEREGAAARRVLSLRGIPTRRGFDRDEYPPAISREGGEADVLYVESSENRSAGAVMGRQLREFCDGQAFLVEP